MTSRLGVPVAVRPRRPVAARVLTVLVAAALAVDAYVHLVDADFYASVASPWVSQATLFRVQAVVALACAVLLLVRPRAWVLLVAMLVLVSAFVAVVAYTYIDLGALGPLPDMYEPTWAVPGKVASAVSEGVGAVLAGAALLITTLRHA
jgi:hypothetical protein